MELVNYTLLWIWESLDDVLKQNPDVCSCEQCRYDIACLAANRLKPNYAVNKHGAVYAKAKMLSPQMPTDIFTEIVKAMKQVHNNPHHLE